MLNEILVWLKSRRSVRRYLPHPVPQALIEKLITAAMWAPSAHNRQPWRFAVITGRETRHELAAAMGEQLRTDLTADGVPPEIVKKDVGRSYRRMTDAPLLILVCLSMEDMDHYPDERRQRNEWIMAAQSTAAAAQNLLLAAHAAGLGACWMCAPLFCPDIVRQALQLPPDWQPQALLTLGYPAETKQKNRRALTTVTRFYL